MIKKTIFFVASTSIFIALIYIPLSVSAQNYSGWSYNNSVTQQNIALLGNEAVSNLTIPVLFGVGLNNLTKNFGEPRLGHAHEGLDIMAPEGTPIVSPTNAVVTKTGFYSGAGNFVTTANPGNESFSYMHLSKIADIKEGDILKPGDLIGYVGYTGNAIASAPHLHFEIRNTSDTPSDPFPRITSALELSNKMIYLQNILNKSTTPNELANFLVTKFKSDFVNAKTLGIVLPTQIETLLTQVSSPTITNTTVQSPSITLRVGSRGSAVVALQTYLVSKNVGSAYKVKPDGAFGPITKQALIDYQKSVGLGADGIYGPKSQAYVLSHP
jgi:hypothetical protein